MRQLYLQRPVQLQEFLEEGNALVVRVTEESVLLKEGKKVGTDLRQKYRQVRKVGSRHLETENGQISTLSPLVRLGHSVKGSSGKEGFRDLWSEEMMDQHH